MRKSIATQEVVTKRRRELNHSIAAIDADLDALTAEHVSQCEPIQRELKDITEKQIVEVVDRTPKSSALEERRLLLIAKLSDLNATLAEAVRRAEDKKKPLLEERCKLVDNVVVVATSANRLVELGRPDLVDQLFTLEVESYWLNQRSESARNVRAEFDAKLNAAKFQGEPHDGHAEALRKINLEISAAARRFAEVSQEISRLRAEIINE